MLVRHAGWRFCLLVITADYCFDGDSRSETSIHLDVRCRCACDFGFSVSDGWMFARQFLWKVRGVGSSEPMPLDKSIAGEARLPIINIQHHHSCHLANVCRSYMPGWIGEGWTQSYIEQESCGWTLCLHWSWSLEDFLFRAVFVWRWLCLSLWL